MYTLHKLLKGGGRRRGKSSDFLTQKENEDIVNILASTNAGTLGEGCVTVGGTGKGQTSKCLCFFTEECSPRHQLRQLLANKYTLHHETNTVLQNTRAKHFPIS